MNANTETTSIRVQQQQQEKKLQPQMHADKREWEQRESGFNNHNKKKQIPTADGRR
jgi:alkyl sulfatase BDS1-like metallo-beta-lactamase superfamily hydrolase